MTANTDPGQSGERTAAETETAARDAALAAMGQLTGVQGLIGELVIRHHAAGLTHTLDPDTRRVVARVYHQVHADVLSLGAVIGNLQYFVQLMEGETQTPAEELTRAMAIDVFSRAARHTVSAQSSDQPSVGPSE